MIENLHVYTNLNVMERNVTKHGRGIVLRRKVLGRDSLAPLSREK